MDVHTSPCDPSAMTDRHVRIETLRALLDPALMAARVDAARERERLLLLVEARVQVGLTQKAARDELCPAEPMGALNRDLRLWRKFGLDGLIDARRPPTTNDVPRSARPLAIALAQAHPTWSAVQIRDHLETQHQVRVSERSVRVWLQRAQLARRPGPPRAVHRSVGSSRSPDTATVDAATAEPPPIAVYRHPFAGAELLFALDIIRGGIPQLAAALVGHAQGLAVPSDIADDRANRDFRGRFLPEYNVPQPRRYAEVGAKFESVRHRRLRRDPGRMKLVQVSPEVVARKLLSLVLLPVAVARDLRELDEGVNQALGRLTGFPYRANTLDKFMRELKYAEAGGVLAVGWSMLLRAEGEVVDAATGAVLVFGDATTHPLFTALYTRSLPVASKHKVMPGMATTTLTNGVGSIVQYSVSSGSTCLRDSLPALLDAYEAAFGPGRANRVLIVDREGHSKSFFRSLDSRWQFIIALTSKVTGPKAVFKDQAPWVSRAEGGEVCDALLLLRGRGNDPELWVRVVGLRRHPEGRTMWFATNTPATPFTPSEVVRIYFQRWPCQELRFRDGKGRVGLHRQHGYGKALPDKLAVLQRTDVLDAELHELDDRLDDAHADLRWLDEQHKEETKVLDRFVAEERRATTALAAVAAAPVEELRAAATALTSLRADVEGARAKLTARIQQRDDRSRVATRIEGDVAKRRQERDNLEKKSRAFAVDHELDEVMLLPRALFLHASNKLQRELLGTCFETDTLIRRILQRPGELHVGPDHRSVVIYRNPHDREATAALERAVAAVATSRPELQISLADPPGDRIR